MLFIGVISVIYGAESWNKMEDDAYSKEEFLRLFLTLPNVIPSHDTFNRVFSNIYSYQFETCFIEWIHVLAQCNPNEVNAIDDKSLTG
jgi:hypothetical protein